MMRVVSMALIAWLSIGAAASAQPAPADGDGTVFHKGDRVLVTPYGGEWWYCTLASDRTGNPPANFSYSAVCDP